MTVEHARDYIALFRRHAIGRRIDYVDTSDRRRIWLDRMTDEDALFVAREFIQMETRAARIRHKRRDN